MTVRRLICGSAFLLVLFCLVIRTARALDDPRPKPGKISGTIVLEDGGPPKAKGWLQSVRKPPKESEKQSTETTYHGEFHDKFSITTGVGTVWIKYFAQGYAPAWAGPLEVAPGQTLETVRLVLSRGNKALLRIRSADAKPIAGAKILAMPLIGKRASGELRSLRTNEAGELTLEHVANTPYYVRVSAPGFEPLIVDELAFVLDRAKEFTLAASQPATGTICDADGKPVQGAKVRRREEQTADRRVRVSEEPMGEVVATTDAAGHFSIDQLIAGWKYVFLVEGPDGSRIAIRTLRAGIEGVQARLPRDQTLRLKIVGDLAQLPKRKGKPCVEIDQWIETGWDSNISIDGGAKPREVVPAEGGGVVEHPGLVSGTVQIHIADTVHTFDVVENGPTEVTIDLDKGVAK